jgi:CrcB protein
MTTFSALMLECLLFARTDRPGMLVAYLAASLVGGLVLVWAGALLGRAVHG